MADDIYKSRYSAQEIEDAITIIRSVASRSGIPVGTGAGSVVIYPVDAASLSALDGRIPSSLAVRRAIDGALSVSRLMNFKGIVDTVDDLPADPAPGDTWQIKSEDTCYSWTGKAWIESGSLCIIGPPGEKGDAFTYDDFTPEQLEELVGPKGDTPKKVQDSVTYQVGDSGKTVPTGAWSDSIPDVQKGKYLWTRRVQQWDTGEAVTDYSVSYFGIDGSGTVNAVSGVSPDETGNVPLTYADVGALPSSGGDMTGPISMNGQPITGLNPPTEDTQAANKGYVDGAVRKAAPRNLLDNSDFRNPVNQRGKTSYSSQGWGYCIDRWMAFSSTATITESGLEISGSSRNIIGQRFSLDYLKKNPEDYVFVYCDANDVVHFSDHKYKYDNFWEFWIECGETTVIKWAALYEGEYTAETLPEYQPKGYGAELAECQRYYQRFITEALRGTYCEDFRPTMRMTDTGQVSKGTIDVDGVTYYTANAEL